MTPTDQAATSEDASIARLSERVGSQRPERGGGPFGDVAARILSRPCAEDPAQPTDDQHRAMRFHERWNSLVKAFGPRYAGCRLANFDRHSGERSKQDDAIATLNALARHVREHVKSGGNVILYGPPGTGKDHLLVAVVRAAVAADLSAEWINGQDLYGNLRDRIDTDTSEERSVRQFCHADVLAISDPVPPKGETSSYSATMLYRIIDRRYRELKSTWITVNVATAEEATESLTGPIFDRLTDNCVTVYCNWPSYRRARKPAWMGAK